ncbi:MAG: ribbon-helix-helix protein, CopG family [Chloroflexi bacterium]|nr:ribbon-helix-helix protein, CopG family [Chloroflexota bacterium]
MAMMVRKQVHLKKSQAATLKRQARLRGVSEAELIREAIEREVIALARPQTATWTKERAYIQSLIKQGPVPGKRTWTREELYKYGDPSGRLREN